MLGGKNKKENAVPVSKPTPVITDEEIKQALLKENYISKEDLSDAEKYAKHHESTYLQYLLERNIITKDLLGQAISEFLSVPYADLNSNIPSQEQIKKIPQDIAERERIVLFKVEHGRITIATDQPKKDTIVTSVQNLFPHKEIIVSYSLTEDIDAVFVGYRKSLETRFSKIIKQEKSVAPEIIDEILNDAIVYRASDVHFEPHEKEVAVRFRIDGVLQHAGSIPKEYYENILNRIKVQTHLRIDEHFAAQDGAMHFTKNDRDADIRVSLVPTLDGEKIVMRMLSEYVQQFGIADIGLSQHNQSLLNEAAHLPFGMIIVSGPTGSGKTTTLYALIKHINRPEVNITTIEDPVEYKMKSVNQIQVNRGTRLTFAEGLRSIVRQDPDIILVGEIRDEETADIATNAALTGHLLFSTFHANDSATTIPRLLDMGVEPFLLASTLELVIAQRLVRKICETCRTSYTAKDEKSLISFALGSHIKKDLTLYKGKGCSSCNNTGFRGRIALFEMLPITKNMEALILKNPSTSDVWKLATKEGAVSLFEDGIDKVKNGITTVEELLRVARPPGK